MVWILGKKWIKRKPEPMWGGRRKPGATIFEWNEPQRPVEHVTESRCLDDLQLQKLDDQEYLLNAAKEELEIQHFEMITKMGAALINR